MEEDLNLRRTKGSELQMDKYPALPTEEDEARMLANRDMDDMASHRVEHMHAISRHKIHRGSAASGMFQIAGTQGGMEPGTKEMDKMIEALYGTQVSKVFDHSPHDLFVELDELKGEEWVEQARWIKYEEDREEGSERWGKAHISSLSFHSLINLRLCLESGKEKALSLHDFQNVILKFAFISQAF